MGALLCYCLHQPVGKQQVEVSFSKKDLMGQRSSQALPSSSCLQPDVKQITSDHQKSTWGTSHTLPLPSVPAACTEAKCLVDDSLFSPGLWVKLPELLLRALLRTLLPNMQPPANSNGAGVTGSFHLAGGFVQARLVTASVPLARL